MPTRGARARVAARARLRVRRLLRLPGPRLGSPLAQICHKFARSPLSGPMAACLEATTGAASAAPTPSLVCTHCGAAHATRSALFRHLRQRCDPQAGRPPTSTSTARLVVVVAYDGPRLCASGAASVAEAVAAAAVAATGAECASIVEAVRTEKRASARQNVLSLALRGARGGDADGAALRLRLPPGLEVLSAAFVRDDDGAYAAVARRVRRCVHVVAVPYEALVPASADDGSGDDDGSEAVFVAATAPGCAADSTGSRICCPVSPLSISSSRLYQ